MVIKDGEELSRRFNSGGILQQPEVGSLITQAAHLFIQNASDKDSSFVIVSFGVKKDSGITSLVSYQR